MIDSEEDKNKFEILYFKYRQLMFRVANDILKDEYLAEDAVHFAFEKIMKNLDKIEAIECPKTKGFVVIVVKRVAIDFYRKRKKEYVVALNQDEEIGAGTTYVEQSVIDKIEHPLIKGILLLPHHYSEIILLKYSHNYTEKQIAKLLGLSEENVKKRLQRAKKKLKEKMEEVS